MSVVYKGEELKVKDGLPITLDLSFRMIKDISEIEGLENLTSLQVLDLSNNYISEIKGLETLTNLEKLYLGGNPIYKNLEKVIAKKKKLSEMTRGEREKAGVDPIIWDLVKNSRFKLLAQPPAKGKGSMKRGSMKGGSIHINSAWGQYCLCELICIVICFIIFLFTISSF